MDVSGSWTHGAEDSTKVKLEKNIRKVLIKDERGTCTLDGWCVCDEAESG